jgi:NodT family efflux transporter outer membrane factor (OMF) lipoprotein
MRLLVVLVLLSGLVGCATHGAASSAPAGDLPSRWSANYAEGGDALSLEWFRAFGSAELDALITDAGSENLDIQAADARIRQADARARAAGAGILPSLDFNASSTRFQGHSSQGSAHETDSSALLSASYEVDFWGKNRAARDSARLLEKSSEGDRAVVALSTMTGVANTYFQVVALRESVESSQITLSNARKLLELVSARRTAGIATPADLALQRAAVAAAEIRVRELAGQEVEAEAALAILVGKKPGSLEITQRTLLDFKEPHVAAGLPAELLARRPDVFSAEQTLRSAHADLVQARAAFFPTISLTATGGIQNPAVQAALLTLPGAGPSSSIGAALVQTIFDGGRLRAARDEASAKEVEMLAHYRAAVLSALWDVEIALSAIDHLNQATEAQAESLSQSEVALTAAQARYQAGSGDFLTVLDAQRTVISAREQMTQYKLARLQAAVGLCKALGGGWAQK